MRDEPLGRVSSVPHPPASSGMATGTFNGRASSHSAWDSLGYGQDILMSSPNLCEQYLISHVKSVHQSVYPAIHRHNFYLSKDNYGLLQFGAENRFLRQIPIPVFESLNNFYIKRIT